MVNGELAEYLGRVFNLTKSCVRHKLLTNAKSFMHNLFIENKKNACAREIEIEKKW